MAQQFRSPLIITPDKLDDDDDARHALAKLRDRLHQAQRCIEDPNLGGCWSAVVLNELALVLTIAKEVADVLPAPTPNHDVLGTVTKLMRETSFRPYLGTAIVEFIDTITARAVDECLKHETWYTKKERAAVMRIAAGRASASSKRRRPELRGGRRATRTTPPAVRDAFLNDAAELERVWGLAVRRMRAEDYESWTELGGTLLFRFTGADDAATRRANARTILRDLDANRIAEGRDRSPQSLALRHAALNSGDERLAMLSFRSLREERKAPPAVVM